MIPLTIILATAIIYALIRAKLDSYLSQGPWKTWAFILGVFFDLVVTVAVILIFDMHWWMGIPIASLFAFIFWLVFDCVVGWMLSGSILYLGTSGWDAKMRAMFLYNKPIFRWKETGAIRQIFFKVWWIFILTGAYFSLYEIAVPMLAVASVYSGVASKRK